MNTSRLVVGASVLLLSLSAVFAVLNTAKTHALRAQVVQSETARQAAERRAAQREKQLKSRSATLPAPADESAIGEHGGIANAETELIKTQTEKSELVAKLRASEAEIAELKKHTMPNATEATIVAGAPPAPSAQDLQAELADTKKQLDASEREKSFISDKIRSAQDRTAQLEVEKKRRVVTTGHPGVRASVLAVNQAYNFVVLNLGGRHGI
ncbi:MAG: hypothetical protein ACJ8KU_04350, partial [Chthoniobacterales bacterium]